MTEMLSSTKMVWTGNTPKPLIVIFGRERETRFLFQTLLELWNYETAEASEILHLTQISRYKTPDLILMDLTLPLVESLTALSEIRKNEALIKTPIVLVSGLSQQQYRSAAFELGASEYLVKPLDFLSLETTLDKYIGSGEKSVRIL